MNSIVKQTARLSMISVTVTAVLTTIHHIIKAGLPFIILGLIIIPMPLLLMQWFRHSGNRKILWIYGLFNVWIIFGFGFLDGFVVHTLRFITAPENINSLVVETSGMLVFIASLFTLYYGVKFVRIISGKEGIQ